MRATLLDINTIPSLPEGTVVWQEYVIFDVRFKDQKAIPEKDLKGNPVLSEHGVYPMLICANNTYADQFGTGILDKRFSTDSILLYAPERYWSAKPSKNQMKDLSWAYDILRSYDP